MSSGRNVTEAHHDKHIRRGRLRAGQARRHDHHEAGKALLLFTGMVPRMG
nr:MAG TPA: hypothetical protein [Caudoviricetes sp.]